MDGFLDVREVGNHGSSELVYVRGEARIAPVWHRNGWYLS